MEFRFKLMQTYYNNLEYDEIGYQELNITDYEDNSIVSRNFLYLLLIDYKNYF